MNFVTVMTLFNYGLVLIYGILLAVDISGGGTLYSKKDKQLTAAAIAILLLVQIAVFLSLGASAADKLYPLVTHIPLICILVFLMKRPLGISIVSVFTAYLCCQIPNWCRILVLQISGSALLSEILYAIAVFISYALLRIFLVKPAYETMNYSRRALIFLGSLPMFYYIFDYASTVYTQILYSGSIVVNELVPTVTILFYVVFVPLYHGELKKRYSMELENSILNMELKQSDTEIVVLQKSLEDTATYRHDMRHHFMILAEYIQNDETAKALDYIKIAQKDIDLLTPKKYCNNNSTNLILSHYCSLAQRSGIRFEVTVKIPEVITLSDTELCTLLSNGIENAINAASRCENGNRWVEIDCKTHKTSLLISIRNSYVGDVRIEGGLPVSDQPLHGFGVKSIRSIVERHNGMYSFDTKDSCFTMRLILNI